MRRAQAIEIQDLAWCPPSLRDAVTDLLRSATCWSGCYAPVLPRLRRALERSGAHRVVDLCSGGGGPWLARGHHLGDAVTVCLTDRYPNRQALDRAVRHGAGRLMFHPRPVDARHVPEMLDGFRTLYSSFHHFEPHDARAILADAVRTRQGLAVFEATSRSPQAILLMLLAPVFALLATPFVRPFRWSRLAWTYALPLVPFVALCDGLVSCLRTYSPSELAELADAVDDGDYAWESGAVPSGWFGLSITYLIGVPGVARNASPPASPR